MLILFGPQLSHIFYHSFLNMSTNTIFAYIFPLYFAYIIDSLMKSSSTQNIPCCIETPGALCAGFQFSEAKVENPLVFSMLKNQMAICQIKQMHVAKPV